MLYSEIALDEYLRFKYQTCRGPAVKPNGKEKRNRILASLLKSFYSKSLSDSSFLTVGQEPSQ